MARVNMEEIFDHLSFELQSALEDAVSEVSPPAGVDPTELFRAFRRAVGMRCDTWALVPDRCVEKR